MISPIRSQLSEFNPRHRLWLWFGPERLIHGVLAIATSIPLLIGVSISTVLIYQSILFFQDVSLWEFLTATQWTPLFPQRQCGIWVIAIASLMIAAIAILVAIPMGLFAAIYLSDYAPPLVRRILKPVLETLSGIPTVVYGYFAFLVITPFLQRYIPGLGMFNALSAGLVTGILITPIISSLSEDAIASVPKELRDGGYAIGFTQHEVMIKIVLPAAFPGIAAAVTLAVSRALGETMIAAIAAGQYPVLTLNPLVPIESMTAFIIQVSLGDVSTHSFMFHTIFAVGLVLFLVTLGFNWLGHWLVRRHHRTMSGLIIPNAESSSLSKAPLALSEVWTYSDRPTIGHPEPLDFHPTFARRTWMDHLFRLLALGAALLGIGVFAVLVVTLLRDGFAYIDTAFLTALPSRNPELAGIYAPLLGTLCLLVLTALIAVPIGIGTAIYLEEYLPVNAFTRAIELHLDNLSAVPSVLYGLLGLALFARSWSSITGGRSLLSAGLVLAVIVLPMLIITTRNALRSIPSSHRYGGYSIGMSRWQVIWHVVLPDALPSIITGMLLALSRAIGETAPLVAIGAVAFISYSPGLTLNGLQSNFSSLPTQIFYWASRPQPEFQHLAAAAIIVLGGLVLGLNILAVFIRDIYRRHSL